MAVSAARANMHRKARMRGHARAIPKEIEGFEECLENDNKLDAETKAKLNKALATIKQMTDIEAAGGLKVVNNILRQECGRS